MKKIALALGALVALSSPAFAQKAVSNSGSWSGSSSGVNYAPTTNVRGGIPGAASVVGSAASTPYKCKDVGGFGVPYLSVALPMSDEECGPIVAALACKEMGMPVAICQTTLTQNKYIRASVQAHQQAAAQQVQYAPAPAYANTKRTRRTVKATSSGNFCDNPATYSPTLCTGR